MSNILSLPAASSLDRHPEAYLQEIWQRHFADVPRLNAVKIAYGKPWKRRLGSIRLSLDNTVSLIAVNALLYHADVPVSVLITTIAHELTHYAQGFGSPHPRLHPFPHANGVVTRELDRRGLGDFRRQCETWIDNQWFTFYEKMRREGFPGLPTSSELTLSLSQVEKVSTLQEGNEPMQEPLTNAEIRHRVQRIYTRLVEIDEELRAQNGQPGENQGKAEEKELQAAGTEKATYRVHKPGYWSDELGLVAIILKRYGQSGKARIVVFNAYQQRLEYKTVDATNLCSREEASELDTLYADPRVCQCGTKGRDTFCRSCLAPICPTCAPDGGCGCA